MRFVADSMLGSLARWLRVLGYDTHYRSRYTFDELAERVSEGRVLLSRQPSPAGALQEALLIRSQRAGLQLQEVRQAMGLAPPFSQWFSRCIRCNTLLEEADPINAASTLPDYVVNNYPSAIRRCPGCGRYYWPGTHRDKMLSQLSAWGFTP